MPDETQNQEASEVQPADVQPTEQGTDAGPVETPVVAPEAAPIETPTSEETPEIALVETPAVQEVPEVEVEIQVDGGTPRGYQIQG